MADLIGSLTPRLAAKNGRRRRGQKNVLVSLHGGIDFGGYLRGRYQVESDSRPREDRVWPASERVSEATASPKRPQAFPEDGGRRHGTSAD